MNKKRIVVEDKRSRKSTRMACYISVNAFYGVARILYGHR